VPREPLVSVLTPSFNQARWLEDNLRSVACQTYPRIEHIVMDGGSNDGSLDLLKMADPKVRWKSEPDRGQSHALNKAFAESGGEIIGWVNSDDAYFDRRVVGDVVRYFDRNPGVDALYGHAAYVNAYGRILHYFWAPPFRSRMLQLYDYIIQPTIFCRRRALGDHLVDESFEFAMDYELLLRLAQRHRLARFARVIAIDRAQPERKTRTLLHVMRSDLQRLGVAYDVAVFPSARLPAAAHHVYCRFRGARLAATHHCDLAFSGSQDRRSAVLWRQIASRRSTMPVGDP
jgi:glycosyltransferase involved in cell wall biosynthesis